MSKLFWILLSGCRGGYRYLRSVLRTLASRLAAGLTTAPGSDAGAHMQENAAVLRAEPVARSVADGRFSGRECGSLLGHMVAWLVSASRFPGRTDIDLDMNIQTVTAADMTGLWDTPAKLLSGAEAVPGVPVEHCANAGPELEAAPEPAMLSAMVTGMSATPGVEALGAAGGASPVFAQLAPPTRIYAGIGNSSLTEVFGTAGPPLPVLTARMMAWAMPRWVDDATLYICQVYETGQDGDVLILH